MWSLFVIIGGGPGGGALLYCENSPFPCWCSGRKGSVEFPAWIHIFKQGWNFRKIYKKEDGGLVELLLLKSR